MGIVIKHRSQVDEGTGTVKPIGGDSVDLTGDLEGPTGAAESTLVRETTATEHEGEPTGVSEPQRSTTVNADWPSAKMVEEAENKQVKTTKKKSSRKSK